MQAFEEYQQQLNLLLTRKMDMIRKFQEQLAAAHGK